MFDGRFFIYFIYFFGVVVVYVLVIYGGVKLLKLVDIFVIVIL